MADARQIFQPEYPTRQILGDSTSNPGAQSLIGSRLATNLSQNMPQDMTPIQKFNLKLMEMLKQQQQLGTAKFREAELSARQNQARKGLEQTPESLIGASPALQSGVREAEKSVFEPQIKGSEQMRQTITEQVSNYGKLLDKMFTAYREMSEEERKRKEAEAKGPERQVIDKRLFERNPQTGTWEMKLEVPDTTDEKKVKENFNKDLSTWNLDGTREQFIRRLQSKYPDIDKNDIAKKVYETYPDNYLQETRAEKNDDIQNPFKK